jgi:hypothetical protein
MAYPLGLRRGLAELLGPTQIQIAMKHLSPSSDGSRRTDAAEEFGGGMRSSRAPDLLKSEFPTDSWSTGKTVNW